MGWGPRLQKTRSKLSTNFHLCFQKATCKVTSCLTLLPLCLPLNCSQNKRHLSCFCEVFCHSNEKTNVVTLSLESTSLPYALLTSVPVMGVLWQGQVGEGTAGFLRWGCCFSFCWIKLSTLKYYITNTTSWNHLGKWSMTWMSYYRAAPQLRQGVFKTHPIRVLGHWPLALTRWNRFTF